MNQKLLIIISFLISSVYAKDYGVWISSSVIWGQGSLGGFYRFNDDFALYVSEYFVWDWGEKRVEYNSERISLSYQNFDFGTTFRKDRSINSEQEISPFISYYNNYFEIDFYNSLEYRYQNLLLPEDYVRYEFSMTYGFASYRVYDFYVKSNSFFNVNEVDLEKHFFYLGVRRVDKNATLSLYVIPYKYGDLGQEWDDISYIGGSFVYRF